MRQAGADWQMVFFGGAVHGYTNPGSRGQPGLRRSLRRPGGEACPGGVCRDFVREIWRVKGED